jgi:hypothetical protein
MPPRRRSSSGYRGVCACLNDTFYAEIRSGDERIGLGTFETAHEAARVYDAVAWRLGRSRRSMNFNDVSTCQQAEMLAPPPPAVTREQRQRQWELEQRLLIAEGEIEGEEEGEGGEGREEGGEEEGGEEKRRRHVDDRCVLFLFL